MNDVEFELWACEPDRGPQLMWLAKKAQNGYHELLCSYNTNDHVWRGPCVINTIVVFMSTYGWYRVV